MPESKPLRVADLPQNSKTAFDLRPDPGATKALADHLDLSGLRKLRFTGAVRARGARDWHLEGQLGATVTQACVVTLEPVVTRIDCDVARTYLADLPEPDEEEAEMTGDDSIEHLGAFIDPAMVMAEALALMLPLYPRKEGADLDQSVFAGPGVTPMRDEDVKPFAGLAGLRDSLKKDR